jgi:hypothetical protein
MEATYFFEDSVAFERTTQLYIPEDRTIHNHRWEDLKSCNIVYFETNALSFSD